MLNICAKCNKPLSEGDAIQFTAIGFYHIIKSTRSWAIDKNSLEADVRSVKHLQCDRTDGD